MNKERIIPHNHEAEQGVLGSMLIQPGCIPDMVRRLKDDSFHHPANAELFALVVQMYHHRIPADAVILTDKLRDTQRLDAIGGPAYISALYDTATAANAVYYADIVREKAQMRLIANASVALYKQVTSPAASVQEAAAMMSTLLSDLTTGDAGYKTMDEHMDDALDRYEKAYDNQGALPVGVVQTGLTEVDEALDAGFYPADFVVLAAETSGGKTALAMNAVCNASVLNQVASAVFSYEMKATQLVDRLVALQSKIPANRLRKGVFAEHEFARLSGTVARMRKANIHLRDRIGKWSVDDVANEARAIKARHGLGLVVVDYLQLMAPRPARNKQHNREREVAEMSRALKDLALELDIPVVALSQLNDDGKLRESRGLGHDADVVMTIENAYEAQDKKRRFPLEDERVIRINKNRSGKRDQAISVAWLGLLMQFSNL